MAATWFCGGIEDEYNAVDNWLNNTAIRASLVAGTVPITTQKTWITLDNFLTLGGNSLVNDNAANQDQIVPTTRALTFPSTFYEYTWTGTIDFGVVNTGTQMSGVVYYDGLASNPTAARVLWVDEFGSTQLGAQGNVTYGSGSNPAARWTPNFPASNGSYSFQGTANRWLTQANLWGSTWVVEYALLTNPLPTPQVTWTTISNITSPTWITDAAAGNPNNPQSLQTHRDQNWVLDRFELQRRAQGGDGGAAATFQSANLTGSIGEDIAAVVTYMYTGAYSAASAYLLNWDPITPNITIAGATDYTYGNNVSQRLSVNEIIAA